MRPIFGTMLLFCVLFSPTLYAQQTYNGWKLDPKFADAESKKAKAVSASLKAGSVDKTLFGNYFGKYYFHRWTIPENSVNLNEYVRKDFLDNDLRNATGDARKYLMNGTLAMMKKMKSDPNVYPAAQVNAVIVLGLLYEDKNETKLYQPALPVLIEEFNNPKAPDRNKVPALKGIIRYAYLGIDNPQVRNQISQLLMKVAKEKDSKGFTDSEIYLYYIRAKAVEGLSAVFKNVKPVAGQQGVAPEVSQTIDTLLSLIEDDAEPNIIRYTAGWSLSQANLIQLVDSKVNVDTMRFYNAIAELARAACTGEQKYIEEIRRMEQAKTSTTSGGIGSGMSSSSMSDSYSSSSSSYSDSSGYGSGGATGNAKTNNRVKQCIGSSKYAFGAVQNLIKGPIARNEGGILTLLAKETDPKKVEEAKKQRETLVSLNEWVNEYIKVLDEGPALAKGATVRRPPVSGNVSPTTKKQQANMPKITIQEMWNELSVRSEKLEKLFPSVPSDSSTAQSAPIAR